MGKLIKYLSEVKAEVKRVSWPNWRECYESTTVVIAFILILALTTLVCDKAIQLFIQLVNAGV